MLDLVAYTDKNASCSFIENRFIIIGIGYVNLFKKTKYTVYDLESHSIRYIFSYKSKTVIYDKSKCTFKDIELKLLGSI